MPDKKLAQIINPDQTLEQALDRFAALTRAEAEDDPRPAELIPEGMSQLVAFKGYEIRKVFHDGEWWFSVVDVISALTESANPRRYWSDLKRQLTDREGFSELYGEIVQLKMTAGDGKERETDAVTAESLLRVIQSVPSPRAEPLKRWLARVGYERIQEIQNPEIAIKRAILAYQIEGRSDDWIEKRIRSIVTRRELTGEWKRRGIEEGKEYAILTNLISMNTFGIDNRGHKRIKGLKQHNLRDHMTDLELIFTMLGEKSTTEIARKRDASGFEENAKAARAGGSVAGVSRVQLEKETGEMVVSSANFLGVAKRTADPEHLSKPRKRRVRLDD